MKKLITKKSFILGILFLTALIYSVVYQSVSNMSESFLQQIMPYIGDNPTEETIEFYKAMGQVISNPVFQVIAIFIGQVISIYLGAMILTVFLRLVNVFKKEKKEIKYEGIVYAYYMAAYVFIFDYIIQILFMLFSGSSLDANTNIFIVSYQLFIILISYVVIIFFVREKYKIIYSPSIFFIMIFIYSSITSVKFVFEN